MRNTVAGWMATAVLLASAAHADFVVDQSNDHVQAGANTRAIGGESEQKLAQTFTVGMTGQFAKVRLPVGCESGTLVIDIVQQSPTGAPSGVVLRRTTVPAASIAGPLADPPTFVDIFLIAPLSVAVGDRLAIVLTNATGTCGLGSADPGDTYPTGSAYFDARPNPPGWVSNRETESSWDLPFETLMEVPGGSGSSTPCIVGGVNGVPIPGDLPICRCIRDQGLREFRCAFLDPAFLAIVRHIPWPTALDRSYVERWDVLALTKLTGGVKVRLAGANIPRPIDLAFAGKSLTALESRKVALKSAAAGKTLQNTATFTYGGRSVQIVTSIPTENLDGASPP